MGGDVLAPSVTVVIPVWDEYVRYLSDAVQSVRAPGSNVPVIVVDNASDVEVPDLDGVATIRSATRLSIGAARDLGIDQVETPYVLVLDADDKLLPGALELMIRTLDSTPAASVSATSIFEADTGGRHRVPRRFAIRLASWWPRLFALTNSIWSLVPIQGCAVLRTDQVRQAGGYADSDWGDDWVLAVSLAFRGRVEVTQRFGRYYRRTEGSVSQQPRAPADLTASARLVRKRIRQDPGIPPWARALLPLIALLQLSAVWLARPTYQVLSRIGRSKVSR